MVKWLKDLLRSGKSAIPLVRHDLVHGEDRAAIYTGKAAEEMLKKHSADLHNEKGVRHFENNEFDAAISEYRSAIESRQSEMYYMNLGNACLKRCCVRGPGLHKGRHQGAPASNTD